MLETASPYINRSGVGDDDATMIELAATD